MKPSEALQRHRQEMERCIAFEDVIEAIADGRLLTILQGKGDYAHQMQFIVNIEGYPYAVPFVQNGDTVFLKTIFPNRKLKHLINGDDDEQ
jgi:hypothetical protein